ncbi:MAG: T9SS type A sorting domain-containing protein [Bacteroidetes bacterium]|nr:T9SS type A sorting domain-containing protein [Bacteroidota bacterium]MCW5895655.1 T9SS type A sorting domain-containing protein [Bacteroidota bacterium]
MNKRIVFILGFTTLLLGGQVSSPLYRSPLYPQLEALKERGMTYRLLDNDLVEVKQEWSGMSRVFSLRMPSDQEIRAWAQARGIPIIEIDPNAIDTSRFTGWYRYWTQVPLSNDVLLPLVVADINRNGKPEVYGSFRNFASTDFETRTYEVDSAGEVMLVHNYGQPRPGVSRLAVDADSDSLLEVVFTLGGILKDYEQSTMSHFPTELRFSYQRYQSPAVGPGLTGIFMGSLDGDGFVDFLYMGSEPDSADTTRGIVKQYVAEFDPVLGNFRRVWSQALHPNLGGFAVGDFDSDEKMDFVSSSLFGNVYLVANTGNDQYQLVWQDSLPFVNAYYQTAGDVNGNGTPEFFVGAVMNGYYLMMYEADSVHHYSPRLLLHFLAGDLYPNNYCVDVDGDGRVELVTMVGTNLIILKADANNHYFVWYLKREDRKDAFGICDFDRDGKLDFIISKSEVNSQGRLRLYADAYLSSGPVDVSEPRVQRRTSSFQVDTYPNPFNPVITIRYQLPTTDMVSIVVLDIGGRVVASALNKRMQEAGQHSLQWNADGLPSGVYFVQLRSRMDVLTRKTLLIR